MEKFELIAPCHFGMEAVLKREILDLGYEITKVEDGKVTFEADAQGIADANIFLRSTERILLKVAEVKAETFDELFEKTKALPWENYIPKDGKFWVAKANSVKSKLFSPSDIQSIMKKAIVERLKGVYGVSWFEEDGASFPIRVAFMKDVATIGIDTSGVSLHKRGYRKMTVKAPITETLASALIMLTPWNKDRILVDPFCGSGTFPIEAAMMAADIAPGMNRSFLAEEWKHLVPRKCWYDANEEARILFANQKAVFNYEGPWLILADGAAKTWDFEWGQCAWPSMKDGTPAGSAITLGEAIGINANSQVSDLCMEMMMDFYSNEELMAQAVAEGFSTPAVPIDSAAYPEDMDENIRKALDAQNENMNLETVGYAPWGFFPAKTTTFLDDNLDKVFYDKMDLDTFIDKANETIAEDFADGYVFAG